MKQHLAAIALAIAFVGLGLAIFRNNFIYPPKPQAEQSSTFRAVATEAAKKILEENILHRKAKPEPEPEPDYTDPMEARKLPLHPYVMVYTALGLLAIGLGITAWCQKGHARVSAAAVAVGLVVACWEYSLIAITVAVLLFVLSNL